jgi:5-methyltetrahydropteroyltriglutamate--homocysteine methyltransferase
VTAPRPPFRADHVGSLLRSPALKARRRDHEDGRIDAAGLAAAEDEAVREAVRLQEAAGLEGITDGELRRKSWHMDFLTRLGGLASEGRALPVTFHGRSGDVNFTRPDLRIDARVGRPAPIFVDAFRFLRSVATRTAKITIPSPCMLYSRSGAPTSAARYTRISTASWRTPRPPTAPRSPTSTRRAAGISSSTT